MPVKAAVAGERRLRSILTMEGGGAAEQPGVAADVAEVLVMPVVLQVLGDVLGSEADLRGGCPASACAPVCALEAVHQGFQRVPESC